MKFNFLKPKKLILFCTIFLIGLITSIPALALDFNGTSGSSGGGGTASSGYAVNTNGTALIGFRFSLVNSSNIQKGNSVDIVSNSNYSAYTSYKRFDTILSKAEWVKYYSSTDGITTSVHNTNLYNGKALGFASNLPSISSSADIDNLSANLKTWQSDGDNIDKVLKLIIDENTNKPVVKDTATLMASGEYKIIIEPLFSVGLLNGDDHILTMTELAVYGGGYEYNGSFTTIPSVSSTNTGSWEFIAAYTNKHFPNYMRTDSSDCNWGAAPTTSRRISFADIITKGYGANVLSSPNVTSTRYTNTIKHWASGLKNGEGNNSDKDAFLLDTTAFEKNAGDTFSLTTSNGISVPNGFKLRNTFRTNSISGSWANYSMGQSITQDSAIMKFEYWYDPIDYKINYELNGGTNHEDNPSTYNVLYEVEFKEPTKPGHTFDGWYVNGSKVDGINYGKDVWFNYADIFYESLENRTTGEITVTAKWTANSMNIQYYSNFATESFDGAFNAVSADSNTMVRAWYNIQNETSDSLSLHNYSTPSDDTYLAREGYTSSGYWGTEVNGGIQISEDATFSSAVELAEALGADLSAGDVDITLYPQWGAIHTIAYNANGGQGSMDSHTVISGNEFTLAENEFTYGYNSFGGWNVHRESDNTWYVAGKGWLTQDEIDSNNYTKKVYSDRWSGALDSSWAASNHSDKFTFYAIWKPPYLIEYYLNDDETTDEFASQFKAPGVDLTLLSEVPSRDKDYIFSSWNTKPNGSGTTYYPGDVYSEDANLVLFAQWKSTENIALKGLGYVTIKLGDVFEPLDHLDAFNIPPDSDTFVDEVVYNGVPRDAENRATEVGTGYTVVFNMSFVDGSIGQYRLIVTVLDEESMTPSLKGYIRSISYNHLDTLETNSKWRIGELWERLEKVLSIVKPTDDDAIEVWHFKPEDVQAVKDWAKESEAAGKGREEQNAEFGSKFGSYQTKGKYVNDE